MRALLFLFFVLGACSTTQEYHFTEYNCDGLRGWSQDAQADDADAHIVHLFWPENTDDNISLFASISTTDTFRPYIAERYHSIVQQTHYKTFPDYVRGAAGCFRSTVVNTPYGVKATVTIDRSSLVIEASNRCGRDYSEKCDIIAMTYVPPAGR